MSGKKIRNEAVIGAFVIIVLALVYFGLSFLKGVNLFVSQTRYYAVYTDIAGLEPSSPVILNGFKIGTVKTIKLEENGSGKMVVEVVLNDAKVNIPKDTKLKIFDSDFFGGKAIQIVLGDSAVLAVSKDTLFGEVELGLTETIKQQIEPLKQKTSDLFRGVDSVLSVLQNTLENSGADGLPQVFSSLQRTINHLESTSMNLDNVLANNTGKINSIFDNVESISDNIRKNNEKITNAISNFSNLSDTLAKMNLASTLYKVDKAMGHFENVMEKVNNGQGSLGKLVNTDSLHNELVSASHSLDLLLDDMRTHPKNYVGFSLFGRRDTDRFSKAELEDMRKVVDQMIKEKEANSTSK